MSHQFQNGLHPVPPNSPLSLYQHLANTGRLFFYDDHIVVHSLIHSPDPTNRPGFYAITRNRDSGAITAHHFKYLGRGFLTSDPNPTQLSDHDLATLDFWRSMGYVVPVLPPASRPAGFTNLHAGEFEDWQQDNSEAILKQWIASNP